ncbi:MAG: galactose-1-phosphate uridylyltransferase [Elusimicrobia bacterium]|nr:galactose-1-phosphate uridylyltransferase [Elusimicrobiota bacterium]
MPELRKDPIIGRWVIIATERANRPVDFARDEAVAPGKDGCPFCEGNETKTPPEILAYCHPGRAPNSPGWWTRVIPNKFPALKIEGGLERQFKGIYDQMNGIGAHEIIIENPAHDKKYFELDPKKAEDVLWAYRDRILDLRKDPRMDYILIFKNHGRAAGASLAHPHAQLIALPMVPISVRREMAGGANYMNFKERCVFCDIVRQESLVQMRIIDENNDFLAFAPFASRFPFESWIIPKIHDSHFENTEKERIATLTQILQSVLRRLDTTLKNPPFNYLIHSAPHKESSMPHYHWHIEIIPKLAHTAGFEWGTGFYINPVPPEMAARYLKESGQPAQSGANSSASGGGSVA